MSQVGEEGVVAVRPGRSLCVGTGDVETQFGELLSDIDDFERTVFVLRCCRSVRQSRIAEMLNVSTDEVYTALSNLGIS